MQMPAAIFVIGRVREGGRERALGAKNGGRGSEWLTIHKMDKIGEQRERHTRRLVYERSGCASRPDFGLRAEAIAGPLAGPRARF